MDAKEMCETCQHNRYCIGAYKKDCWCGNYLKNKKGKQRYTMIEIDMKMTMAGVQKGKLI